MSKLDERIVQIQRELRLSKQQPTRKRQQLAVELTRLLELRDKEESDNGSEQER
jgi:hypothetical protein